MERDFRIFTAWIEETLQTGVAEENELRELKLAEKSRLEKPNPVSSGQVKAS